MELEKSGSSNEDVWVEGVELILFMEFQNYGSDDLLQKFKDLRDGYDVELLVAKRVAEIPGIVACKDNRSEEIEACPEEFPSEPHMNDEPEHVVKNVCYRCKRDNQVCRFYTKYRKCDKIAVVVCGNCADHSAGCTMLRTKKDTGCIMSTGRAGGFCVWRFLALALSTVATQQACLALTQSTTLRGTKIWRTAFNV